MDLQYEARGDNLVNEERPPIRGAFIYLDRLVKMTPEIPMISHHSQVPL